MPEVGKRESNSVPLLRSLLLGEKVFVVSRRLRYDGMHLGHPMQCPGFEINAACYLVACCSGFTQMASTLLQ